MHIVLSSETQRLLEERMRKSGYKTPDEAVRVALETLDDVDGEPLESLDLATLQAIECAEAQSARGEGRPWEDVRTELRAKYLNK